MTKTEKLSAELRDLGVDHDPNAHWKTLQAILKKAKLSGPPTPDTANNATTEKPSASDAPSFEAEGVAMAPGEVRISPSELGSKEPPTDPRYGDKTPEVVKWRRENWPSEKFNKHYQDRIIP